MAMLNRRSSVLLSLAVATAMACLATAPALAQQIAEETATRFPNPNPTEFTNQATFGDIDGDNDLDIIFANGGNFASAGPPQPVRVYINDGSGFFTDESAARTGGQMGLHRGVELGDCDNDGDLDMILVQDFQNSANLLINNGSGFFTNQSATRLPSMTFSSSRGQFGDVDNDGDLDLFITTGSTSRFGCGQYRLYLNDGTCNYTDATATHFPIGNVCENMDCIFGDIDNDFDIDIRTGSTGNNNSRLYKNDGTGVFIEVPVPNDSTCYSYDFGDIDGDGDLDMLGANGQPGSSQDILLENDGTGTYTNVSGQISPNINADDNDSKFFDMDNDGDLDMVVGRIGGPERLYRNTGGNFALTTGVLQAITDSTLDIMVGDLNGDGTYDIVTAQGESGNYQNRIYINSGPADTIAPNIVDTEPVLLPDSGPTVIRALILDQMTSDRNFFDDGIFLNYSVNAGPDQAVEMAHSGGQVYRGVIPPQSGTDVVEYWVTATDHNGNTATGDTRQFTVPDCSLLSDCSGNGVCVGVEVCDCDDGWDGDDCSTFVGVPAGRVPDGTQPGDRPIEIRKLNGGDLRLTWDDSCGPDDIDFAVYQGTIGDFTGYTPITCTTGGVRGIVITPDPGGLYWLVVPSTSNGEGSYGLDGDGIERPSSVMSCGMQALLGCQ
jgi:hypothetical protein